MTQTQTAEESFGAQVREARELRGWTQEQLRRQLRQLSGIDLSSTAMARLEQGKRPIRFNEVAALAKLLGLDLWPYSGTLPSLTSEEYEHAVNSLEGVREQEQELARQLAQLRERFDTEYRELEQRHRTAADERYRLEVMISDYEALQRG